jgi:hypothetical protein
VNDDARTFFVQSSTELYHVFFSQRDESDIYSKFHGDCRFCSHCQAPCFLDYGTFFLLCSSSSKYFDIFHANLAEMFTVLFRQVGHVTFFADKKLSQPCVSHNSTTTQRISPETISDDAENSTGCHYQRPGSTRQLSRASESKYLVNSMLPVIFLSRRS